jgi:tetratricopeptide (TPR) repeat protein
LAHSNLGIALRTKGNLDEAIAGCRQAIELDPKYAKAHYNLGAALHDKGQLDEAIASFRKAVELDPKYALAHYSLGFVLVKQGQRDEAIPSFRKAIELDPKYAMAHYNLGVALHGKGQVDEAIASFRKAIELDPKYALAHNNLGNLLSRKGQFEEASACLRKAIELDPKDHFTAYRLSSVLAELGDLAEYQKYCKTMLSGWGEVTDATLAERTVTACLRLPGGVKDLEQLAPLVKTALAASAKHSSFGWFLLAQGLHDYRSGRFDKALIACRKSRERKPNFYLAIPDHCVEAMAYHYMGETDEARRSLAEAKELFGQKAPNFENGDLGNSWHDWLTCRILLHEAETLIEGKKAER